MHWSCGPAAGGAGAGSPLGAGFTRRREAAKASCVGTMTNTNLASSRLRVFACDPMIPTLASYRANPGVVRAFRRVAGKDKRSCILCLALDGQEQPTGELLATHPRCRCAVVPLTRSWEELGFPEHVQRLADEAEASRPGQERGEAWFRKQSAATQRAMLGPGGLALYQKGASLRDFVDVRHSPDWGPTLRRKPLAEVGAGDVAGFVHGSGSSRRPGHLISRDEVPAWLADSAVKQTTVHVTSRAAAESIWREGVRIKRTGEEGKYGYGFYSAIRLDPQYGDTPVWVAVKLRRPLVLRDSVRDMDLVYDLAEVHPDLPLNEAIRAGGYDGVVVYYGGGTGDGWVVAFDAAQVKIVEERGGR